MDIRQIQALHAQYASHPVVIDIAGHVKAMPALPAPDAQSSGAAPLRRVATVLRRAGKPAAIFVAVAALAAGGGISAARVWHALHASVVAPTTVAASALSTPQTMVAVGPGTDMQTNAAPPRPLAASDFGGRSPEVQSALANVDPRALIAPRVPSETQQVSGVTSPSSVKAGASASPIRAMRPPVAAQPASVAPGTQQAQHINQPGTDGGAAQTTATASQNQSASVAAAAIPPAKPALRPIRHITAHRSHESAEASSATGALAQTAAPAASAGNRPASTGKSGDVQLF